MVRTREEQAVLRELKYPGGFEVEVENPTEPHNVVRRRRAEVEVSEEELRAEMVARGLVEEEDAGEEEPASEEEE